MASMTEISPWEWENHDIPRHHACLPTTRQMTKLLEKLKGYPAIVDHLGTLEM